MSEDLSAGVVQVRLEDGTLQMSIEAQDPAALETLLGQVVHAAGGKAGMLTTLLPDAPHTSSYGLLPESSQALTPLMEDAAHSGVLDRLQEEAEKAGTGRALALPVRRGGRPVGVFCIFSESDAPGLNPGTYHLHFDKLAVEVQNAELLQRLLHERKWLEAVVQHSSDGVVIVDEIGRVVAYNPVMCTLSGWGPGEAIGTPCHETFPLALEEPGDSTALRLAGRQQFFHTTGPVEARLLARNGGTVEVEVSGAPLWDRKAQPLGWVMTVRDITCRKEKERLQKLFLSAISHELHTPIAIIRGFAGLIADPELAMPPDTVREKARIIVEESGRLERMVGQMLYATRIQAGGIKLNRDSCDLASLIKATARKVEPLLKDTQLFLKLSPELPTVLADAEKAQQVLTNLIENALKYAGRGPIQVSARQEVDEVWVEVTDSGPGVPVDERDRIFSPFERGGDPLKSRVRGAGLGLFISKSIVEAHGGRIGVKEGDTGGACFFFTLPVEMP